LYIEGATVTVLLRNSGAAICSQWGIPTHRRQYLAA
jgi:hypothetical protein